MKTKESILGTVALAIIGAVATKIIENIFNLNTTMETTLLIIFGAIGLFSTYKLYRYLQREEKQKEADKKIVEELQKSIKTHWEDTHEIMIMRSVVLERKQQHLYNCVISGRELQQPENSWLTDEELRLHELNDEKRWEEIKRINKLFKNNEPNTNNGTLS